MSNKDVVLAFSGGLDTSFCVPYLQERGYNVHAVFADTGGVDDEERDFIEKRAAELGVTESRVSQLRTEALALLRDAMNSQLDPQRLPAAGTLGPTVTRRREALYAQVAANALAGGVVARALVPAQRRPDHDLTTAPQHVAVSWTA